MLKKSILIWLAIIPLAILNGGLRETFLIPLLGEKFAQPLSGIILCLFIFLLSFIFVPRLGKGAAQTYRQIGFLWVVLTLSFETSFGLAEGLSFGEILKAYDITTGNLWLIVVIFIGIAPRLIAKIKRLA